MLLENVLEQEGISMAELREDRQLFVEGVVEGLVKRSYQGMKDSDRRIMEALAVFGRPVEEEAIRYLLQGWYPKLNVGRNLRGLVKRYFVREITEKSSGSEDSKGVELYSLHSLNSAYSNSRSLTRTPAIPPTPGVTWNCAPPSTMPTARCRKGEHHWTT